MNANMKEINFEFDRLHKVIDELKEKNKNQADIIKQDNEIFKEYEMEINDLKEELISAYRSRGNLYVAREKEWIDSRIKELKTK
jgi:peptidoglycan hydrolase CwlO-like protein